uniref:FMN-binding negative transcriptional regulator n=1 Tax=uncultured Sphingomonas sp. TaxID=158754 RepID=UPI0035CBB23D
MHPARAFRSDADPLAQAAAIGFAHVFAGTPEGPMVVHAPVTRHGDRLRFHVARANRIAKHLDGATLLLSVVGPHGYISSNWYERPGDQVPTWNYVAVEIDGQAAPVGDDDLVEHLDTLAANHEPHDRPWTRDEMDDAIFRKMLGGIRGFAVTVAATRTTDKRSQNKTPADRACVIAGLD